MNDSCRLALTPAGRLVPAPPAEPVAPRRAAAAPDPGVQVSVVIATNGPPVRLRRCLLAVLAQRLDDAAYEIIVLDDSEDDAVLEVVMTLLHQRAAHGPTLRYLRRPAGSGTALARNHGWQSARGRLIAFTADDTEPDPEWLANGLRAMDRHPAWSALCGRVSTPGLDHSRRGEAGFASANLFVRHSALVKCNGFDERFTQAGREDADLHFRLLRDVGPVGRCDGAVVLQSVKVERWDGFLHQQRNQFFDALLYKKHPRLYRERVDAKPPWDYYLIVALTLLAPWLLWEGHLEIAALLLGLAVSLVLQVAEHRLRATTPSLARVAEMLGTSLVLPFVSVYWRLRGALRFRVLFL